MEEIVEDVYTLVRLQNVKGTGLYAVIPHSGVKIYILKADTCISPKGHVNPNIMPSSSAKKILSFLENRQLKNNSLKPVKMLVKNCMKF